MTVLIIIPQLPLELKSIKGGVHSALVNLLEGFAYCDVQIEVIVFSKEVRTTQVIEYAPNIHIHYVYEGPFPFHSLNYFFKGPDILKKYIRKYKPDVIHYEEGNSFLLSRLFRPKADVELLTIHGMAKEEAKRKTMLKDRITWYFNGWLQQWLLPDNIIHLSAFSRQLFQPKKKRNEVVIPNAMVSDFFQLPIRPKTGNHLLYVGVIDNNKNLIHLLKAMSDLKKEGKIYTLNVLGGFNQSAYKQKIEDYVAQHGLSEQLHFRGWVNQEEVRSYLSQSDILVVCSKHESLPMVIAESKAASKVVVASAVGGIPEMINHGVDGFLFNLQDETALKSILSDLYDNHALVRRISEQAKTAALQQQHSKVVAEQTLSFYHSCKQS